MTGLSSELIFENARQSIQIWIDLHHFPVEQIGSKLSLFRLSRHYDDLGCAQSMPPDLAVLGTRRFTAHPIRASRPPLARPGRRGYPVTWGSLCGRLGGGSRGK